MENLNTAEIIEAKSDTIESIPDPYMLHKEEAVDPNQLPDIIFVVQSEKYSVSSQYVLHIGVMPKITVMNGLDAYCRGITIFNEQSVPVIDLRKLFGISSFEEEWDRMIHQRMEDHRRWVRELENSVENDTDFTLTTDPHQCAFGKWYDNFSTDNSYLNMYLRQIDAPHTAVHKTGELVKKLMKEGKKDEARAAIADMKKKYLNKTLEILENMSKVYKEGRREMLIMMQVEGTYISIVADSISSIRKLTDLYPLPEDEKSAKEDYIESLAKENNGGDVVQMLDPLALLN